MKLKLSAVFFGTLLMASCSNDEVQEINQGNEITFNTRVSRASDIDKSNLDAFKVWAIWPKVGQTFIDGVIANKVANKDYFTFERSVFWPNDVEQLNFWAVAPSGTPGISITAAAQSISNFNVGPDLSGQVDLVVAYEQAMRSGGTSVGLTFQHALSQIVVRAKAGVGSDDDIKEAKTVKIKGAWIMNVKPQGTVSMTGAKDDKNVCKPNFGWEANGEKTYYGKEFDATALTHGASNLLAKENGSSHMLLVPQELDKWNIDVNEDKEVNAAGGAYILLLCRVEGTHKGKLHEGQSDAMIKPSEDGDGDVHTHQMFPCTEEWDAEEYGYTCVPINTKWEPGKKYIYTLVFCGQTSGAGIYPPTDDLDGMPDGGGKYIKTLPDDKKIGDPVLDNPIQFTVEVADWTDAWTEGTTQPMK